MTDMVNHPPHYTSNPAKCCTCSTPIECIDITRHFNFNLGNVIKYIWRSEHKDGLEALKKAQWYLNDYIKYLEQSKIPGGIFEKTCKLNNYEVSTNQSIEKEEFPGATAFSPQTNIDIKECYYAK